jgi:hypothetical protein
VAVIDGEQIVLGGGVIMQVQGIPVRGLADYKRIRADLAQPPSGGVIKATVLRDGQVLELTGRKP